MHIQDFVGKFNGNILNNKNLDKSEINTKNISADDTILSNGEIFEGSIKEIKGNKVTIVLSDGKSMVARLEADINLSEGSSFFFQVKSNDGKTIEIVPFENSKTNNPIIQNVISEAGLILNDRNIDLVNTLMQRGLSIGNDNLIRFGRILAKNPDVDVNTLVKMDEFNIDITPENIDNFIRFEEQNNYLLNDGKNFLNDISNILQGIDISKDDTINLLKDIINSFFDENINNNIENDALNELKENTIVENDQIVLSNNSIKETFDTLTKTNTNIKNNENIDYLLKDTIDTNDSYKIQPDKKDIIQDEKEVYINIDNKSENTVEENINNNLKSIFKDINSNDIKDNLSSMFDKNFNLKDNVSINDFFNTLNTSLKNNPSITKDDITRIYSNKSIQKLLGNLLEKSWSLKPKELSNKDSIKKLYDNINRELNYIISKAQNILGEKNPISSKVLEVKSSIQFMNELNKLYSYVQIPLKMMNETATGDLYVYQDRKRVKKNNDEFSAFLHLSLKNLGDTDIHVKMYKKNVNIDFSVDNEISFNLINKNLYLLDEKLIKKGYIPNTNISKSDKKENFVENLLGEGNNKKDTSIKRYSFDVRA